MVPRWLWWAAIVSLLVWTVLGFLGAGGQSGAKLPYSAFIAQVGQDNVASVDISGQAISGSFRQPTLWPQGSAAPSPGASASPAPSASAAPASTYTQFTTVMPAYGDPGLLPALEAQHVTVSI